MSDTSEIWTGKANSYDRVRPTPPPALLEHGDAALQYIGSEPIPWYFSYRVRIGIT